MPLTHWARLFVIVLVCAFGIIAGAQLLKGHDATYALEQGAIWGALSAAVFTGSAFYRWRRNIACALCDDIAGARQVESGSGAATGPERAR